MCRNLQITVWFHIINRVGMCSPFTQSTWQWYTNTFNNGEVRKLQAQCTGYCQAQEVQRLPILSLKIWKPSQHMTTLCQAVTKIIKNQECRHQSRLFKDIKLSFVSGNKETHIKSWFLYKMVEFGPGILQRRVWCEIRGSHDDEYENGCLLEWCTV